jgi:hypothetical protein
MAIEKQPRNCSECGMHVYHDKLCSIQPQARGYIVHYESVCPECGFFSECLEQEFVQSHSDAKVKAEIYCEL